MKTLKINETTHEALTQIKAYFGYKTLDETIDMCIGEFAYRNLPLGYLKRVYGKTKK